MMTRPVIKNALAQSHATPTTPPAPTDKTEAKTTEQAKNFSKTYGITRRDVIVNSLKRAAIVGGATTAGGLAGVGLGGLLTAATGGTGAEVGLALAAGGIAVAIAAPVVFVISFIFFTIILGIQAHRTNKHLAALDAKNQKSNEELVANKKKTEEQPTPPADQIQQPQKESQPTLSLFDQIAILSGILTLPKAATSEVQ